MTDPASGEPVDAEPTSGSWARQLITNRLITAVAVSVAGMLVAVLAGRAEGAALVVPWVVLLILGLQRGSGGPDADRPLEVGLGLEQHDVVAGSPVVVNVEMSGVDGWVAARWLPAPGALARQTDADGGSSSSSAIAGPDGRVTLQLSRPAATWGTHDVGRVELAVGHRYGLTITRGQVAKPLPVRIHPRPIELRNMLAPHLMRRLTGAHQSTAIGRGIEFADIRPFGPGDSPRDINWRASARADELLVSERHPDRATDVILLVDAFVEAGHDVSTTVAQSIEAAVALADSHLSVSDRVGLIQVGGVLRWFTPGSGRLHLQRLVDGLLATKLYRTEAERSLAAVSPRVLPPRSFVIALSPLLDQRFIDTLLGLRGAGHDVAVIEFPTDVDPAIDDVQSRSARSTGPQSTSAPARLALRLWRAERDLTRERLGDHGIAVVTRMRYIEPEPDRPWTDEPWDQVLRRLGMARRRTRGTGAGSTIVGGTR
jgi:uncharacterized protein (DUF58 family)